jgi:hypothetical protein
MTPPPRVACGIVEQSKAITMIQQKGTNESSTMSENHHLQIVAETSAWVRQHQNWSACTCNGAGRCGCCRLAKAEHSLMMPIAGGFLVLPDPDSEDRVAADRLLLAHFWRSLLDGAKGSSYERSPLRLLRLPVPLVPARFSGALFPVLDDAAPNCGIEPQREPKEFDSSLQEPAQP